MGFKRKRSSDDSPLSISSFGGFLSTPESLSPTPLPEHEMAMDLDSISTSAPPSHFNFDFGKRSWGLPVTRIDGSDLGSRTRKRFRDNRPDEDAVHQKTMNLLFSAQRNASATLNSIPNISVPTSSPSFTPLPSKPQKSTLHAFWNLPAPPVTIQPATPLPSVLPSTQQLPHCEDCDAPLHPESGMDVDVDMDVDANGGSSTGADNSFACNDCGRSICGTCAVVSRTRHCLGCATKGRQSRRWW